MKSALSVESIDIVDQRPGTARLLSRGLKRLKRASLHLVAACLASAISSMALPHEPESVSLVSLLARPDRHEGKFVSAMGYFSPWDVGLYLTSGHSDARDMTSMVSVMDHTIDASIIRSDCAEAFARVEGTFIVSARMGPRIVWVTRVLSPDGLVCWSSQADDD